MRSDYEIEKIIRFEFEPELICLLPTVFFQPWKYRYLNTVVVCFSWLGFNIGFGVWRLKDKK